MSSRPQNGSSFVPNQGNMSPRTTTLPMNMGTNRPTQLQSPGHNNGVSMSYSMRASNSFVPSQTPISGSYRPPNNGFDSPRQSFRESNTNLFHSNNNVLDQSRTSTLPNFSLGQALQQQSQLQSSYSTQNQNNNNNQHTPTFSSKMSMNNSFAPYQPIQSSPSLGPSMNQSFQQQQSGLQQQQLPVIVPVQQPVQLQDPLLKSIDQQQSALESRQLMRVHYKGTGYCIFVIFALFLILSSITYWISYSRYKDDLQLFTQETCIVQDVIRDTYTVTTPCGISNGFRYQINIKYNGVTSQLCSAAPYACYNATATPPTPDPENIHQQPQQQEQLESNNINQMSLLSQFTPTQLEDAFIAYNNNIIPYTTFSTSNNINSIQQQFNTITNDNFNIMNNFNTLGDFQCSLCLRNNVDQCFSHISLNDDEFQDLTPGKELPCWEYTQTVDNNDQVTTNNIKEKKLFFRYFDASPKQLNGYPYIHSWYVFFFVGTGAFLLIGIYYLVKGVGICDCIDPSYWKKRNEINAKKDLLHNQSIAREEYLIKQNQILNNNDGNNNNMSSINNSYDNDINSSTNIGYKAPGRSSGNSHFSQQSSSLHKKHQNKDNTIQTDLNDLGDGVDFTPEPLIAQQP